MTQSFANCSGTLIAEMDATRSVDNDSGVGHKNRASHCDFTYIYIKFEIRSPKKKPLRIVRGCVSNFVERLMCSVLFTFWSKVPSHLRLCPENWFLIRGFAALFFGSVVLGIFKLIARISKYDFWIPGKILDLYG